MKFYYLSPPDGFPWLAPDQVVARLKSNFPRVLFDAAAAQERGQQFIGKYRDLLGGGLGSAGATPLEVIERMWSGALVVEVWADPDGVARFQTIAYTDCHIAYTDCRMHLEFGHGVPPRSQRSLALRAAQALGYVVESWDPDRD